MNIVNLVLENFLSFSELNLDISGVNVIQGINKDDDGQETNGSGKTAIQSAIEYALFATTSRGIPTKELIKWGNKKAYVLLRIYCPIRKEELTIERGIGRGSKLELTVNNFPLDFANVNDGNKQIIDWIGISKEDLQNYYIINKEKYESFYTSSNRKKLEMIGRFSNLSILDQSDFVVQEEANKFVSEIEELNHKIGMAHGRIEKCNQLIEKEKSRDFDAEYIADIENVDAKIKQQEEDILSYEKSIKTNEENITIVGNSIINLNIKSEAVKASIDAIVIPDIDSEVAEIEVEIKKIENNILKLEESYNKYKEDYDDLRKQRAEASLNVNGSVVCPSCSFQFNPAKADINIEDEISFIKDCDTILKQIEDTIIKKEAEKRFAGKGLRLAYDGKNEVISKVSEANKQMSGLEERLYSIKKKINNDTLELDKYVLDITNKEEAIIETREVIANLEKQKGYIKKGSVRQVYIASLNHDIQEDIDTIYNLKVEAEEVEDNMYKVLQWKYNFKMFKSHLSMNVLNVITSYTNKMLLDLKSSLQVKWEGFKVKTNGDLSDKITPLVIRDGVEHSFGSYSGGEKGRLEYASILSNQYLINSTHKYGGLNFLSTDEITEGIDSLGLRDLVASLELTGKTILLTTHIVNESYNNVLTVVKENGCSTIKFLNND